MFFVAQIIILIGGLIGIGILRRFLAERFSAVRDSSWDILLIVLVCLGVTVSILDYLEQGQQNKALQQEVDTLRDYSEVARLSLNGTPFTGGAIRFNSELSLMLEGTFQEVEPNRFRVVCTDDALDKDRAAIAKYPRFPFAYYWLALCLRQLGDPTWRSLATQALQIFERTTRISGHHPNHDEAQEYLRQILTN